MLFTVTTKQINVIWGAWKRGEVKADKQVLDTMYRMVKNQGCDGSCSLLRVMDKAIRGAIDAIFSGNLERAQECIDAFIKADSEHQREMAQIKAGKAYYQELREQAVA